MADKIRFLAKTDPEWALRSWHPKEPWQNAALAALGSEQRSAALREAVLEALFPGIAKACVRGHPVVLSDSGNGPDWVASCRRCPAPAVLGAAEHKPRWAAGHYKPCSVSDLDSGVRAGLLVLGPGQHLGSAPRGALPPVTCERPHPWATCGELWPHKGVAGGYRLALPQVVVDSLAGYGTVRLVTDRGTASEVYKTDRWDCVLDPARFPVTTTADLLNELDRLLPPLSDPLERAAVARAFTLLWARTDWQVHRALTRSARSRLQPWAAAVAWLGWSTRRVP